MRHAGVGSNRIENGNGFGAIEIAGLLLRPDAPIRKVEWLIAQARDRQREAVDIAQDIISAIQEKKPGQPVEVGQVAEAVENALAFIMNDEDFDEWNEINKAAKREAKEHSDKTAAALEQLKKEARIRHRQAKKVGNEAREALDNHILIVIQQTLEVDAREPKRNRQVWTMDSDPYDLRIGDILLDQLKIEVSEGMNEPLVLSHMEDKDFRERVKTALRRMRRRQKRR